MTVLQIRVWPYFKGGVLRSPILGVMEVLERLWKLVTTAIGEAV